jgi:hypothetical protein
MKDRAPGRCDICGYDDVQVREHEYGRFFELTVCEICEAMPSLEDNLNAALAHCVRLIIRKLGGPKDV